MSDLIDRQAAIDSIEKHLRFGDELYPLTDTDKVLNHAFSIAASCVYNLPSAQPEPHWIPCSERLPFAEYGGSDTVLTTCGYKDVEDTSVRWSVRWIRLLYFYGGNWCYPTGETYEQKVYAWMPLPEPYQEDEG